MGALSLDALTMDTVPIDPGHIYEISEHGENTAQDILIDKEVPGYILNFLFGDSTLMTNILFITDEDARALDNDTAVQILSTNNLFSYEEMHAFTLNPYHMPVFLAIKNALGIEEDLNLPLIISKSDTSIIDLIHELTHVDQHYRGRAYDGPSDMGEYLLDPDEYEAAVNTTLVFRMFNPKASFYDFCRERSHVRIEDWPDHNIEAFLKIKMSYLNIDREIWDLMSRLLSVEGLTVMDALNIKYRLLEKMEEIFQKIKETFKEEFEPVKDTLKHLNENTKDVQTGL
jgi:hypothetical protein